MKRISLFCSIFIFFFPVLWAKEITQEQALKIAETYISTTTSGSGKKISSKLRSVRPVQPIRSIEKSPAYYMFNIDTLSGFVVVSGDDELTPVIGYADQGEIVPDRMPDALNSWLEVYSEYVDRVRSGKIKVVRSAFEKASVVVSPMITTRWNQDAPFNGQCPEYNGRNMVTGCVATALAQIMKYHNWPGEGEGSNTYYNEYAGELSADFSQSRYDWDNMIDVYEYSYRQSPSGITMTTPKFKEEEGDAVAKLMSDVGISINMNYTPFASGSNNMFAYKALVENFKYSGNSLRLYERDNCTTSQWVNIILSELQSGRPLYYSGSSKTVGHAFVCDGIDSNNFLHINWGWGGLCDGFFDMNYMDPDDLGIGGGEGSYIYNQAVMVGIRPAEQGEEKEILKPQTLLGDVEVSDSRVPLGTAFTVTVNKAWNYNVNRFEGEMGIALYQNDKLLEVLGRAGYALDPYYLYTTYPLEATIPPTYENGEYELRLVFRETGRADWIDALFPINQKGKIPLVIENNFVVFGEWDTQVEMSLLSSVIPMSTVYSGCESGFKVSLRNESKVHLKGSVSLMFMPVGKEQLTTYTTSAMIYGESDVNLLLKHQISLAPGDYEVSVFYTDSINGESISFLRTTEDMITVHPAPTVPVLILAQPLKRNGEQNSYMQNEQVYQYFLCNNQGSQGDVQIGLFARSVYTGAETCIADLIGWVPGRQNNISGYVYGDLSSLDPGEYILSLKYVKDNIYVSMEPEEYNRLPLVVTEAGAVDALYTENVRIYPNPVMDKLHVYAGGVTSRVEIYSSAGSLVWESSSIGTSEFSVPVNNLLPGIYILKAETDNGIIVRSFVKK
ncbi:thiol protease/hemagglutinin PrtT [Barnesiella propionica]|uniref:thiol protease/hemagglutinin PrtT n=1 Tax=Barnesiella propionica TaxID=2981781 RepID=UPI001431379B|nr:thiol protease/hemagglutinin PrtT [Barnesiella propionica]MCU6767613.1 thiol protease/hemagglutinin PrtT [Barnesiella propionica]